MIARQFLPLGLLCALHLHAADVPLFNTDAPWRLLKGTAEASSPDRAAWRTAGFNDAAWTVSPGPFYFTTTAGGTEVPFAPAGSAGFNGTVLGDMQGGYSCIFLRKSFTVASAGDASALLFSAACDDGFVAWINGVEVVRYNLPAAEPLFNGVSNAALGEPVPLVRYILTNTTMLVNGVNVIAVQAFNASLAGSSDFGFMGALSYQTDDIAPVVALVNPLPNGVVSELTEVDVDFSEPVTGLDAGDLLVNGTGASGLAQIGAARYAFTFPQPPTGAVSVAWRAGHGITDLAHTPNPFAGGSWNYTLNTNVQISPLAITEFLASNARGFQDDDGQRSDWIEINNGGPVPLNLGGWFLTDDPADLTKWRFPEVTLGATSNRVVFASGKNRTDPLRPLHTSFKLSVDGGFLALVSSRTNLISVYNYPRQQTDVSYGRDPVNGAVFGYFLTPTPGRLNGPAATNLAAIISDLESTPVVPKTNENIVVTARITRAFNDLTNVTLRYRVMYGPEQVLPMADDGAHGDGIAGDDVYGAIIPVSPTNRWHMIRWYVRAVDALNNVTRLPLFTDPNNQPEYYGTVVDAYAVTSNLPVLHWFIQSPTAADNTTGSRCSLFYRDQFRDNVRAYIHGQSSSGFPKHSYNIDLNPGYKLRWSDDAPSIDDINLLSTYADKSHMRNILNVSTLSDSGTPAHFVFAVRVHQNGRFYSVANFVENGDDNYLNRIGYDPKGALYKMYNTGGDAFSGVEKKTRKQEGNQDLADLISGAGQANATTRQAYMFDNMDIPSFINFAAQKEISSDHDCCHKNYYFYRDSDVTREWRALPWDFDLSFGRQWNSTDGYFDDRNLTNLNLYVGGNNTVVQSIFNTPATKQMYLRRVRSLADQYLGPIGTTNGFFEKLIERQKGLIGPDAVVDFATWATWGTPMTMTNNANQIYTNYLPGRRAYLLDTLSVTKGGEVPLAQPTNAVVGIAGIEFNPSSGNQDQEWIALTNANTYAVDISGWKLGGGIDFTFRGGTVIPSAGVLHVSPNVVAFRARTTPPRGGQSLFVVGPYSGRLSAWGESLRLTDPAGRVVTTNGYPPSPGAVQQYLRITEIMYHPSAGGSLPAEEYEYLELRNTGPVPLDLRGVRFVNGVEFDFTTSAVTNLAVGASVLVVRNAAAFVERYGGGFNVAGQYVGSLDNSGESLRLDDATGEKVLDFRYDNRWYPITDGAGFSLVIVNDAAPFGTWGERASWRASGQGGGSPGAIDPPPTAVSPVLITEAVTRTVPPARDAVELHNPGVFEVDVGGWFLSDDFSEPKKFRLPPLTIPAGGYAVLTEDDFNPGGTGFALGADGDQIWLFAGDGGTNLTGYYHGFAFGAADEGVSFGRQVNSQSIEAFVAQVSVTLGSANSGPRVGPVVLSEIMYHPPDDGTNDNTLEEFIELQNLTASPVPLFDPAAPTNTWRLRGGVDFVFPAATSLAPAGRLLVVGFNPVTDPAALTRFRTTYFVPAGVPVLGPWSGRLDNSAETVLLEKPAPAGDGGIVPFILIERVAYGDAAPWPATADGAGGSLQRANTATYGDDPLNWYSSGATPGSTNFLNLPPTISILAPASGTVFQQPTNIVISVDARDPDGDVTLVEFFANGAKIGESTAAPFSFTWTGAPFGTQVVRARARDNGSVRTDSATVTLSVVSIPPVVSLTGPADGAILPAGNPVTLSATASDPDGSIVSVSFFVDGVKIAERPAPPYTNVWTAGPVGSHDLTAIALDSSGTSATSAVARVYVPAQIVSNIVLVASNSVWRYLETTTDPAATWKDPGFDDTNWKSGKAQLGFGDNDEGTRITNQIVVAGVTNRLITYYFRQQFTVGSLIGVTNAQLRLLRDDGAAVYLNGAEVLRSNLTNGPINYRTLALAAVAGADESTMFRTNLQLALLQPGINTLAVEVHQARSNDTDLSFAADLVLNQSVLGPAIIEQPRSRTNAPGTAATFAVTASGTEPLGYQWRRNGLALDGEVLPVLTIGAVQPSDAAGYSVVITNVAGAVTSSVAVLSLPSADTDGDGLPDDWELANGTNPDVADAGLDPDADGMTNAQEFLAGTDPRNTASVLRLSLTPGATAHHLHFSAIARRSYKVEYRTGATAGAWSLLTNLAPAGADRAITIADPRGPGSRFYRLEATPQP